MTDGNRPVQPSEVRQIAVGNREAAKEERLLSNPHAS